jgi:hypothetical protein
MMSRIDESLMDDVRATLDRTARTLVQLERVMDGRSRFERSRSQSCYLVAIVLAALATGCASTPDSLRARFSKEYACPESRIGVNQVGGNVYAARGCGRSVEYVCGAFTSSSDARGCEERGSPVRPNASAEAPRFPGPSEPEPIPGQPHR